MGFPERAFERVAEALQLADELQHPFTQAVTLWKAGQICEFAGQGEAAYQYGRRSYELSKEQQFAFWTALGLGCQGVGLKLMGRYDEAVEAIRESISLCQATGASITFPKYKGHLADALWHADARQAAWVMLSEAFAHLAEGERYFEAELHRLQGDFYRDQGDTAAAKAAYMASVDVAKRQRAISYELRSTLQLCQILIHQDAHQDARRCLEQVIGEFTEGFDTPELVQAHYMLDELA